jgi:pyruvate/2-oxoglutarate dehydrogenase complex dihydrolipoamide dehydrogenase (E3) component
VDVVARQHPIVRSLQSSGEKLEQAGVRLYMGKGAARRARAFAVGGREVRGERIVIVAGSAPVIPPFEGQIPSWKTLSLLRCDTLWFQSAFVDTRAIKSSILG